MERLNLITITTSEQGETTKQSGKLIVITGRSGAGKDAVIDELLIRCPEYRRLITCADRKPREGLEIDGVHYYFVSPEKMDAMADAGELVEKPLTYGTSRKATPKKEFSKVLYEGNQVVWRIDMSLAIKVASGDFFDEQFSAEDSRMLKEVTKVIIINAPQETIDRRRKDRDRDKYDPVEYRQRDQQESALLEQCDSDFKYAVLNEDGKLDQALENLIQIINS